MKHKVFRNISEKKIVLGRWGSQYLSDRVFASCSCTKPVGLKLTFLAALNQKISE